MIASCSSFMLRILKNQIRLASVAEAKSHALKARMECLVCRCKMLGECLNVGFSVCIFELQEMDEGLACRCCAGKLGFY